MNPGKWKYRLKSAVHWWFSFDPYPFETGARYDIVDEAQHESPKLYEVG